MATTGRPLLTARLAEFGTTIFTQMSELAQRTGAINLGQGFPDTDGPPEIVEAAVEALRGGHNQYAPGPGIPALREAIAAHQRRFHGLDPDPDGEVLVTTGATEAIAPRCSGCATPATRSSRSSRTTTPTPHASPWPARPAARSRCARPATPSSPTSWPPRSPRARAPCS